MLLLYFAVSQACIVTLDTDLWSEFQRILIIFPIGFITTFCLILLNQTRAGRDFFLQAEKLLKVDHQFRIIFDHCQEPIVIIKGEMALYANSRFLSQFQNQVKESTATETVIQAERLSIM